MRDIPFQNKAPCSGFASWLLCIVPTIEKNAFSLADLGAL